MFSIISYLIDINHDDHLDKLNELEDELRYGYISQKQYDLDRIIIQNTEARIHKRLTEMKKEYLNGC